MFSAKAALATISFGLGAGAMAVAVYSQQPKAFTKEVPPAPAPPAAAVTPVMTLAPQTGDETRPMSEMVPIAPLPVPATPAVETEILPCSGWQTLASGPEGRRVRYLCQMPPPDDGPRPGS